MRESRPWKQWVWAAHQSRKTAVQQQKTRNGHGLRGFYNESTENTKVGPNGYALYSMINSDLCSLQVPLQNFLWNSGNRDYCFLASPSSCLRGKDRSEF